MTTSHPADSLRAAPPSVAWFAWRVAARIDFLINLLINGAIAAWLYRSAAGVTLVEGLSLAAMLVPMAFFLCAITTVFGWWNAVRERRAGRVLPPLVEGHPWFGRAVLDGVAVGAVACAGTWLALRGLAAALPAAALPAWLAVTVVGTVAGVLGYLFHGRAVVRGGRWHAAPA
jgi:hypothetical protein